MTKFVVVDTEGSGLFDYSRPADDPGQPRLAALAMIFLDDRLQIERQYIQLVKPDGWVMSAEAEAVNGLSMDRLRAEGVPVAEVLAAYTAAIEAGYAVAAFNAQHDCKTMRAELRRADMPDLFERTPNFCCMRKSNGPIPKASGKKGWPSLREAKAFLEARGVVFEDAAQHQALPDALVCVEILRYLQSVGVDLTPEVHFKNQAPGKSGKPVEVAQHLVKPAVPLAQQEIPE